MPNAIAPTSEPKVRDLTSAEGATSLLTSGAAATLQARGAVATSHNGYAQ